jgi:hypothetical protein
MRSYFSCNDMITLEIFEADRSSIFFIILASSPTNISMIIQINAEKFLKVGFDI